MSFVTHRTPGFTLVELLITISIFAILVMLAMPTVTEYLGNTQIRNAGESILNGVRYAQGEAVKRNTRVSFVLDPAVSGGWTVVAIDPDAGTDLAPVLQSYAWIEGAPKVTVTRTPGTTVRVTFNGVGRIDPANPDATVPLTRIDITNAAMPNPRPLQVAIGLGGTKLCDPDPAFVVPDPMACPP